MNDEFIKLLEKYYCNNKKIEYYDFFKEQIDKLDKNERLKNRIREEIEKLNINKYEINRWTELIWIYEGKKSDEYEILVKDIKKNPKKYEYDINDEILKNKKLKLTINNEYINSSKMEIIKFEIIDEYKYNCIII